MNYFIISIISSFSIALAAILGIIRYPSILKEYRPFIFFIWLGLLNEIVSLIFVFMKKSNSINSNIYVFLEFFLILLLFYMWNSRRIKQVYISLLLTGFCVWIIDNFLLHSLLERNSLFRVYYSFVIVLLSINQINRLIVDNKKNIFRNAMFLIYLTFIVYYSYKTFIEVFYIFHIKFSIYFYTSIVLFLLFINFVANLAYAIAVLCIPKKREFTLPY